MRQVWVAAALGVLAAVLGACGGAIREESGTAAPAMAPLPPAPPTLRLSNRDILVCVVRDGELQLVRVDYDTRTGDTLVGGRPFAEVYPETVGYAGAAAWYVDDEPMTINGRRHVKYGVPRLLGVHELTPVGEYRGVPVFVEKGADARADIKYVPVRRGCEFQPYDGHANVGAVRG